MNTIRTAVVDDADLARERLRLYLGHESDIEIVGEAASGEEAVRLIVRLKPDLVFLDIELPDMDGFEIVRRLPPGLAPTIIYVTAHDDRALEAFDVSALDYLLKPFARDRFAKSLDRARHQIQLRITGADPRPSRQRYPETLGIKDRGDIKMVRVDTIDYIDVAGHYLCVHAAHKVHLIRGTLHDIERQLDPHLFARIHRSTLVRVDRVQSLRARRSGDFDVVLVDNSKLVMSRTYGESMRTLLGRNKSG